MYGAGENIYLVYFSVVGLQLWGTSLRCLKYSSGSEDKIKNYGIQFCFDVTGEMPIDFHGPK